MDVLYAHLGRLGSTRGDSRAEVGSSVQVDSVCVVDSCGGTAARVWGGGCQEPDWRCGTPPAPWFPGPPPITVRTPIHA